MGAVLAEQVCQQLEALERVLREHRAARGLDRQVAHELDNGLTVVIAFRELLDQGPTPELLADAERAIARARALAGQRAS